MMLLLPQACIFSCLARWQLFIDLITQVILKNLLVAMQKERVIKRSSFHRCTDYKTLDLSRNLICVKLLVVYN